LPPMFYLININGVTPFQRVVSTFHPFQWRNWTPQAMLYLKGASKLHINLTLRLTKNGRRAINSLICPARGRLTARD
uniref:Leptin receptor n=1 Tax=Gadus morhua TaxID=8049 RepID=A0A8C5CY76_GADMO